MSRRRDGDYLNDIIEAAERIIGYTADLTYAAFLNDNKTQDAVLRNLQIIGEAVKRLSGSFKRGYPGLPWREMAGMRDKITHEYFGINYDIVWTVAHEQIPRLLAELEAIREARQE